MANGLWHLYGVAPQVEEYLFCCFFSHAFTIDGVAGARAVSYNASALSRQTSALWQNRLIENGTEVTVGDDGDGRRAVTRILTLLPLSCASLPHAPSLLRRPRVLSCERNAWKGVSPQK